MTPERQSLIRRAFDYYTLAAMWRGLHCNSVANAYRETAYQLLVQAKELAPCEPPTVS